MKNLLFLVLFLTVTPVVETTTSVPVTLDTPTWVTDDNLEKVLRSNNRLGDQTNDVIAIEFWAAFNKDNAFKEWNKLEGVSYYRADISKCPVAKKNYRIRMAPTIILFVDGTKEKTFKAGLDLVLPAELGDIQESINELKKASQF
jgi:hypothetical protein